MKLPRKKTTGLLAFAAAVLFFSAADMWAEDPRLNNNLPPAGILAPIDKVETNGAQGGTDRSATQKLMKKNNDGEPQVIPNMMNPMSIEKNREMDGLTTEIMAI